jgi:hypothetical protein
MMPKPKPERPVKINKKTLLKLLSKREFIEKQIQKKQRHLAKIDKQISSFATWLKRLRSEN